MESAPFDQDKHLQIQNSDLALPVTPEGAMVSDLPNIRFSGEAGAINAGEIINSVVSETAVAYHGLRARISEIRADRASDRIERLEHKDRLYEHLGAVTLGQTSTVTEADGSTPRPETWAERRMDRRMEKKAWKRDLKQANRKWTVKTYARGKDEQGRPIGGTHSDTMGRETRFDRTARLREANEDYLSGALSARELRARKMEIDQTLEPFENVEQRRTSRELRGSAKKVIRAIDQPVASRWRVRRLSQAESAFDEHEDRAQHHRDDQERAERKRANRRRVTSSLFDQDL